MACVVGPTDAGMAKMDKGNIEKVYAVWTQRINKELEVNAPDRDNGRCTNFRVGHKPSIMCQKVNNWDPRTQGQSQDSSDKDNINQNSTNESDTSGGSGIGNQKFGCPPVDEINDPQFLGVDAYPPERFDAPQSEYHNIGWLIAPPQYRTNFAKNLLTDLKNHRTTFTTGTLNKRDKWFREDRRSKVKNPMAHHVGFITGLGENPYEKTLKDLSKLPQSDDCTFELQRLKKADIKAKKRRSKSVSELLKIANNRPHMEFSRPPNMPSAEMLTEYAEKKKLKSMTGSRSNASLISGVQNTKSVGSDSNFNNNNNTSGSTHRNHGTNPDSENNTNHNTNNDNNSDILSDVSSLTASYASSPYVPSIVSETNSCLERYRYREAVLHAKVARCKENLAMHANRLRSIDVERRRRECYDDE